MQNPLTHYSQGFATKKLNSILTQILPTNQLFLSIRGHRLTEVLETLESAGFTSDTALFLLACCQKVAV